MLALLTDRNLRDGLERGELKNKSPAARWAEPSGA